MFLGPKPLFEVRVLVGFKPLSEVRDLMGCTRRKEGGVTEVPKLNQYLEPCGVAGGEH